MNQTQWVSPFRVALVGLLIALFVPLGVVAKGLPVSATIGDVQFGLPSPEGFSEPSALAPNLRHLGEAMTHGPNRLLALFVSDDDLKAAIANRELILSRYFMVQTSRSNEGASFSERDFASLCEFVRSDFQSTLNRIRPVANDELRAAIRNLESSGTASEISMGVGEVVPLEFVDDTEHAFSSVLLTKYTKTHGQFVHEVPLVTGASTVLKKGKVVLFYAYTQYRSMADVEWVRDQSRAWVREFLGNVQSTPSPQAGSK